MGRINNLGREVAVVALVALAHLGLLYGVAEGRVGGTLFAAGDLWAVALVLLLVVVRFSAIVLLPALVLCKVTGRIYRWWELRRRS